MVSVHSAPAGSSCETLAAASTSGDTHFDADGASMAGLHL